MLPRSVRGRAIVGAALAMIVFGLAVGSASYVLVTRLVVSAQREVLQARVTDVVEQVSEAGASGDLDLSSDQLPNPVLVQVVDAAGQPVASSPGIAAGVALCPRPLPTSTRVESVVLDVGHGPEKVLQEARPVSGARVAVCGILSEEPVQRTQSTVLVVLAVVLPLVVAGVCLAVWLAVSRALRSVDDLRRQAKRLADTDDRLLRVQRTDDEVELLGTTLNSLLEELHHKSRSTRQFVADAGHELRTPLATLRVALEFAEGAEEEDLRVSVHEALDDLARLERLIQDLLALARSDSMETSHHFEVLAWDAIVRDAIEAVQRQRPTVELDQDLDGVEVRGDGAALRSLVTNLLSNAMRHAGSRVTVTLHVVGDEAVLRVDDDGIGLAPQDATRVFDRFVRLDDARERDSGGSGLGLAIVASVAVAHGGCAVAEPGPGGHFVVALPLA